MLEKLFSSIQKISDLKQQVITIAKYSDYLSIEAVRLATLREEILRSKKIIDEDERHEATTELLIRLAVIGHFKEALQIAFGFQSAKWKAQALPKIFVYVPKQFQAETLRLIFRYWRKLSDQSATNELISNLAPYLSPAMVIETIKLIKSLELESIRTSSFTSILSVVSIDLLRDRIVPELSNIGDDYFANYRRQELTIAIARRLAQLDLQSEAFELALSVTRNTNSPNPYAYEAIIPYLPIDLLWRVYEESASFSYEGARHWIYKTLAPRFAELGDENTAVSLIAEIKMPMQRALAYASVVPYATKTLKIKFTEQSIQIIEFMQAQWGNYEDAGQSEVLGNLVEYFTLDQLRRAWLLTLKIELENERREAISRLSVRIIDLPLKDSYWFWTIALHQLSIRSRKNLLSDLQALSSLFYLFGGENSVAKIIQDIHHINNWWDH